MATQKTHVQSLIDKHQGLKKNLIAILLDIQEHENYLSPESLRAVAKALGMPLIDVIGVATFIVPSSSGLAVLSMPIRWHRSPILQASVAIW